MTEQQVRDTVLKYLCRAVDGLAPEAVDGQRSMKELGANSIDIVEVVSSSMRELRIKIPRAELNKLENVDGLVQLLHATAQAKNAAE